METVTIGDTPGEHWIERLGIVIHAAHPPGQAGNRKPSPDSDNVIVVAARVFQEFARCVIYSEWQQVEQGNQQSDALEGEADVMVVVFGHSGS